MKKDITQLYRENENDKKALYNELKMKYFSYKKDYYYFPKINEAWLRSDSQDVIPRFQQNSISINNLL